MKTPYANFQKGTRTRPDRLAQAKQNEPDTTNLTDMCIWTQTQSKYAFTSSTGHPQKVTFKSKNKTRELFSYFISKEFITKVNHGLIEQV